MSGNYNGALKAAAKRLGISVDEYARRRARNEKWCTACKAWHPTSAFIPDSSRGDGLAAACEESRSRRAREKYVKKPRRPLGRFRKAARDGDKNCYAERMVAQMAGVAPSRYRPNQRYAGLTVLKSGEPHFTGSVALWPDKLVEPLSWRKPRTVFVCSQSDLFYEERPFEHISAVYAVMAATPHIKYLVLTKRPERRREFFSWLHAQGDVGATLQRCFLDLHAGHKWMDRVQQYAVENARLPLPNVGEGVSVEDQATADERIPVLLATPAAMRFVSYEPAIGSVTFDVMQCPSGCTQRYGAGDDGVFCDHCGDELEALGWLTGGPRGGVDWVIAGAESGPGARPAELDWFRSVRDQCAAASVPFFLKQADVCDACNHLFEGEAMFRCRVCGGTGRAGKVRKGCPALDGVTHDARPAWLTGDKQ